MKTTLLTASRAMIAALCVLVITEPFTNAQTVRTVSSSRKASTATNLDWFITTEKLWETTPDDFEKAIGSDKFVWQDKDRTHARFNPDDNELQLNGAKVGETLANFKNGKLAAVTISYLNKGDDYKKGRGDYNSAIAAAKAALLKSGGTMKEEIRPKNEQITKANASLYRGSKALFLLEHLFLEDEKITDEGWYWIIEAHAEFVRLRIQPPNNQLGVGIEKFRTSVTRPQLTTKVKREGKKAIIEGVPMVNQGSKGYCAVASLERVLRYYGADIDMHDLANLANTYGGTAPSEMKVAVHKAGQKLGMTTRTPVFDKFKDLKQLAEDYNRAAVKANKNNAPVSNRFYYEADNELVKSLRTKSSDYVKFKTEIVGSINKGIPLMWGMHLGLFWEDQIENSYEANRYAVNQPDSKEESEFHKQWAAERQAEMDKLRKESSRPPSYMQGGHMRLIIGYDVAEDVIFYSDSWGPGHEIKKMKIDEAYAGTHSLMVLEPR